MEQVYQKPWVIYGLCDPTTEDYIEYIGFTTQTPSTRLSEHISKAKYNINRTCVSNWVKSLLNKNVKPVQIIIEKGDTVNWPEREQYWISYYRNINPNLKNLTEGGEGVLGWNHSEETKLKLSEIVQTYMDNRTDAQKQAMSDAQRNRPPHSEETRAKISNIVKNRPKQSTETIAKRTATRKGNPVSEQARINIQVAAKNRKPQEWSEERRLKHSERMSKREISEATRAKLRENVGVKILCVETGRVYNSMKLAAISVNGEVSGLRLAMKANRSFKGLNFKKLTDCESVV